MADSPSTTYSNDPRLAPYLTEQEGLRSSRALEGVLELHAYPVIDRVIRHKLGVSVTGGARNSSNQATEEAIDIRSEILVQILDRLDRVKKHPETEQPIGDFVAYVGVCAYNAINMHLRRKRPNRFSLENKVKYLLKTWPGLALWQTQSGEWAGGFASWREREPLSSERGWLREALENPKQALHRSHGREAAADTNPARTVAAICDQAGGPMLVDHLVLIMAAVWDVRDEEQAVLEDHTVGRSGVTEGPERSVMGRLSLPAYWAAMQHLPATQCASLLLDTQETPEGRSIVDFLIHEGLASPSRLAKAMQVELKTLAEHWQNLPLPDARIAEILGVKPQSVTRARMMARQYLSKCLLGER